MTSPFLILPTKLWLVNCFSNKGGKRQSVSTKPAYLNLKGAVRHQYKFYDFIIMSCNTPALKHLHLLRFYTHLYFLCLRVRFVQIWFANLNILTRIHEQGTRLCWCVFNHLNSLATGCIVVCAKLAVARLKRWAAWGVPLKPSRHCIDSAQF